MILVVDDFADTCHALQRLLERSGYSVSCATNAQDAMGIMEMVTPRLIILDAQMPGCSGLNLMMNLRTLAGLGEVPVLFYSASTDNRLMSDAKSAGALEWIVKGLHSWDYLLNKVRQHYPIHPPQSSDQNPPGTLLDG